MSPSPPVHEQDYISMTDMVRNFDGGSALIEQWLKNKDTVLFLGIWEQLNNPGFNSLEFEGIKNEAGRNSFFPSAKRWIDATGAIGLHAKVGRYGGTYAHRDIAFEFDLWLSPEFKLYLIKKFQWLMDEESRATSLECNHFAGAGKPIAGGKGAVQAVKDYHLSRYACYSRDTSCLANIGEHG